MYFACEWGMIWGDQGQNAMDCLCPPTKFPCESPQCDSMEMGFGKVMRPGPQNGTSALTRTDKKAHPLAGFSSVLHVRTQQDSRHLCEPARESHPKPTM